MDLNLKDKIVLITGGSKGLGRAIAHRFASEGCHLHLVARTQETLDEAANALRQQFPVKVSTFAVDLAQRGSAQRVAETCGDVDILVNNAGDVPSGSLEAIGGRPLARRLGHQSVQLHQSQSRIFRPHEGAA